MRYGMKYILFLSVFLFVSSPAFSEDLGQMRMSFIQGDVQISTSDTPEWSSAVINTPLYDGDRLWAPEGGRFEIEVRGGVFVRADENSSLDVISLTGDSMQLYMDRGHVFINNRRGGIQTVQIDTSRSSIRTYDNSIMLLDVAEDGTIEIQVLKGFVYAENREGRTRVASGSALSIREDGSAELAPIGSPDEWENWNVDRDKQFAVWGESSRYLPDELHEYSAYLDSYGRWAYTTDFGYVWNPSVTVIDWVPYREGRWKWVRNQYVWISYEPWGWAPYHYGRWSFISGMGWCWVPPAAGDIYWAPGYVAWVSTPEYIGWVPLAPGETYYGYGYYGPSSVNITTVNVNTIVVRDYRNSRVQNGVTVVRRDTFTAPDHVIIKPRENPFLQRGNSFLPPAAAQARQTVRQVTGREPMRRQQQPPERIQRTKPSDIRTERKLVREREASVFRPEQPKPLQYRQVKEPKVIIRKPPRTEERGQKKQPERRENRQ